MSIKSKRVNLSVIPSKINKIIRVGRENRLHAVGGNLGVSTICTKIVYFFVDLFFDVDVQAYLRENGGTLLDLISRSVKYYISSDDNSD